jgi:hypothetical protein
MDPEEPPPRLRVGEEGGEEGGVVAYGAQRVVSEERCGSASGWRHVLLPRTRTQQQQLRARRASSGVMGVPKRAPPGAASSPGVVGGDDILAGARVGARK